MKKGFGILEVIVAAVVLAFMILGLNTLQKGNRENILRVRARDMANTIAQDIIDSLSALGPASVVVTRQGECPAVQNFEDLCRKRSFDGAAGNVSVDYAITIGVPAVTNEQNAENQTNYSKVSSSSMVVAHQFAKQVDITVSWQFKKSPQSISVSSVIQ